MLQLQLSISSRISYFFSQKLMSAQVDHNIQFVLHVHEQYTKSLTSAITPQSTSIINININHLLHKCLSSDKVMRYPRRHFFLSLIPAIRMVLPTRLISAVAAVLLLSNNAVDAFSNHVSVSCAVQMHIYDMHNFSHCNAMFSPLPISYLSNYPYIFIGPYSYISITTYWIGRYG